MFKLFSRHPAIVIAISALLFAVALWFMLVARLNMGPEAAVLITGLATLSVAQLHVYLDRSRDRKALQSEIQRIMVATHDLLTDFSALRSDVDSVRTRMGEKNYLHADRLSSQIETLETVVERLVEEEERRGGLEDRLAIQAEALAKTAIAVRNGGNVEVKQPASPPEPEPATTRVTAPAAHPSRELIERVTAAVGDNRADIHLQPVVTLPQRKVKYYEALMRLRDPEGHLIMPSEFLAVAETDGLVAEIDNLLLFRSIALIRRFNERRQGVAVFCNISPNTLLDPDFFPNFIEFMEDNREIAPHLVIEIAQERVDEFGPLEEESIHALAELGFRFSMDHVTRLDFNFATLADLGFRFVKIAAGVILDPKQEQGAQVHPEDMPKLAARHNIELIAEKIESESMVVNLLDFDFKLAQGYLFARPRLVRENGAPSGLRVAA